MTGTILASILAPVHPDLRDERGFTPQQRIAIQLLASGERPVRVAGKIGASKQLIDQWLNRGDFVRAVKEYVGVHEDAVRESLLAAEQLAAQRLTELIRSSDDKVALAASLAALDRAGSRGKPVERKESKTLSATISNKEIEAALCDPGVQARLRGNPEIEQLFLPSPKPEPASEAV